MLSEDTTTKFRAALREHCSDAAGARDKVSAPVGATVRDVAREAREGGMSAEQFVIWVKHLWDEVMDEGRMSHISDPGRVRDVVVSSAIKAYYVQ